MLLLFQLVYYEIFLHVKMHLLRNSELEYLLQFLEKMLLVIQGATLTAE